MKKIAFKQQGGFTLLELLVVVAILAVIAGGVIAAISGQEERAGQGGALHTMAALENATRQHEVIYQALPNSLDALYCADVDDTGPPADTSAITASIVDFGGTSNTPFVVGGLTQDFADDLQRVALPADAIAALRDAGLTEVRVVHDTYCDQTPGQGPITIHGVTIPAADDVPLQEADASLLHQAPDEAGFGRARRVPLNGADTRLYVHQDPVSIGGAADDIIVVLGVSGKSSLTSNGFIGRAPRDGNVPGIHYGNYSLAFKIGELGGDDELDGDNGNFDDSDFDDGVSLVAVLDSDGDYYDQEFAEFKGAAEE